MAFQKSLFCFHLQGLWKDLGLPESFRVGSHDFMHFLKKSNSETETDLSFFYFKDKQKNSEIINKSTENVLKFNEYYLIDERPGFKGLNLLHQSYVKFVKESNLFVTAFDNRDIQIGPSCVIEENCKIGNNSKVDSSILLRGVNLGEGVTVQHSILDEEVTVNSGSEVSGSSVIARGVTIQSGMKVKSAKMALVKDK